LAYSSNKPKYPECKTINVKGVPLYEEYRARYGFPWRRGLVSARVSKRIRKRLLERIRNGSFKPRPDNKAAVAAIRAGRRRDQPFLTRVKSELGKEQSRRNLRYGRKDYEKVLLAMLNFDAHEI
jgi:hypothetical protein